MLSSYHVKNLLFWLCEEHPAEEWTEDSLGRWIHHLLHYVAVSLAAHNITHYMVRENNMIKHRSKEDVVRTLDHVRRLINCPFSSLEEVCMFLDILDFQHVRLGPQFSGENRSAVLLYVLLVEVLKAEGLQNLQSEDGVNALRRLMNLNMNSPPGLQKSGMFYTSTELSLLLYNMASAFAKASEPDSAISTFTALLKEDPKAGERWHDVYVNLACCHNYKSKMCFLNPPSIGTFDTSSHQHHSKMDYFHKVCMRRLGRGRLQGVAECDGFLCPDGRCIFYR